MKNNLIAHQSSAWKTPYNLLFMSIPDQEKKRLDYLDAAKGIGIILVVFGHTLINDQDWLSDRMFNYIYVFHMPLFFMISGLVFGINRQPNFFSFFERKVKSLIVPYLVFSFFSVILFLPQVHRVVPVMQNILMGQRQQLPFNEALWFLPALFAIEVFFFLGARVLGNKYCLLVFFLVASYLGFPFTASPVLPWSVDAAAYYSIYYCIGFVLSKYLAEFSIGKFWKIFGACACIGIYFVAATVADGIVNPHDVQSFWYAKRYLVFFTGALSGALMCLVFGYLLKAYAPLISVGRNSLLILGLHLPLRFLVIEPIVIALGVNIAVQQNNLGFFYFCVTCLFLYPAVILFRKIMQKLV